MNRDFRIALVPGAKEGELQILLYIDGGAADPVETARKIFAVQVEEIDPPPPQIVDIDPSLLGELRGEDGKRKVESAIKLVSDWVLGNDVALSLKTFINTVPADTQVRIIFSADKRLRGTFDLTKVPVELIRPKGADTPFAINPRVASILHLLDDVGMGRMPASTLDWPLRVLIMRSNPQDLGLAVPEAIPIRDRILGLSGTIGPGAVVVDVISSEAAVGKPATWDEFTKQLNVDPYDIVIYLGHGALKDEGGESIGCLQFEDGVGHKDIPANLILVPFQNKPVPVVLLVACQTADQIIEEKYKNLHAKKMPDWIRGSQGVAQALINSPEAGTQLVVGMRYKLDTEDAIRFLENFFESLLRTAKGNVEAAIHLARRALLNSRFPAAFSGPVVFRRLRSPDQDEPLFPFIANKTYVPTLCQGPKGDWKTSREILWDNLKSRSWGQRSADSKDEFLGLLRSIENKLIQGAVGNAPLILPELVVGLPGEKITFAVKLHGSLGEPGVSRLKAQLLFDNEEITIEKVETAPELKASGYEVQSGFDKRIINFTIEPTGDVKALQNVTLFNVILQMGPSFNLWSAVSVSGIQTIPQKIICPGVNAVVIPPQ